MFNGANQSYWSNSFYHLYQQQHAQLTHWFNQVHQHLPSHQCKCGCAGHTSALQPPCHCSNTCPRNTHIAAHNYSAPVAQCCMSQHSRHISEPHKPLTVDGAVDEEEDSEDEEEESEDEEDDSEHEDSDEEGSQNDLVFNVDAILELRALREISDHESVESFEFVDAMENDMHEHLRLGSDGTVECYKGKLGDVNTAEDVKNALGQRLLLYGEKGAGIVGASEAFLSASYARLCDTLQPIVWPVLPLRL